MTTILVVQLPTATAEEMRRLAAQHDLGSMSLHEIAGYLLQLLTIDELKQERINATRRTSPNHYGRMAS